MPSLKDIYKKIFTISDVIQAKGDLVSSNGSQITRLPVGSNTQVLVADSSSSVGFNWVTVDIGYAVVNSSFTQPALNGTVTVSVSTTRWMNVGMFIHIETGGTYEITALTTNTATVRNSYSENTSAGTNISLARRITPSGRRGMDGNNAYTTTTSNFVVPAVEASISVNVVYTSWVLTEQTIYIEGAGYYRVDSKTSSSITITNLGYDFNTAVGTTIVHPKTVGTSGVRGEDGVSPFSFTTASAIMPSVNGTVTLALSETRWLTVGQHVYLGAIGAFQVQEVTTNTATLLNIGSQGSLEGGSSIPSSSKLVPSGLTGLSGSNALVTALTSSFAQPAIDATTAIAVSSTEFLAVGSYVFVEGGGYYKVESIDSATGLTIRNIGNVDNVNVGITVPTNRLVIPSARPGVNGSNGIDGVNGTDGTDGLDGVTPVYLGEFVTPPVGSLNNIYRNNGEVYWYDGVEWKLLLQDGSDGVDGQVGSVSSASSLSLAHQGATPASVSDHLVLFSSNEGLFALQPSGSPVSLFPLIFSHDSISTPYRPNLNFTGSIVSFQDDSSNNTLHLDFSLPLSNLGDLLYHDGGAIASLSKGLDNQVLQADDTVGLKWGTITYAGLTDKPTLGTASSKNAGTGADEVLLLAEAEKLPILDGSNLTNVVSALPDIIDLGNWTP